MSAVVEPVHGQEAVDCASCGADDTTVLFDRPLPADETLQIADYVATTDRYDRYGRIVRCRRCGLVYANPRPRSDTLRSGYAAAEDAEYAEEDASRSINAHMALRTIRKFASGGRLLDVGCSTGFFLNAARLDFDVRGIELSRWAVDYARRRLRLDVQQGCLETADLEPGVFDVVTLNDVIEHLPDPRAALQRVRWLLRPGGLVYLVTPDIGGLAARILRGRWWGLRPAHLYYFSRVTLARMLLDLGLRPVLMRSYGRIFSYGYWLSRLRGYPRLVYRLAAGVVSGLGIEEKLLYLDTRDSVEVCAVNGPDGASQGAYSNTAW